MLGQHLLGLYEKALPEEMALPDKFRSAKKLGFDYLEISVDESDEKISRLYLTADRQQALGEELRSTGLGMQSLCLSAHRRFPFGSADSGKRKMALEIMEKAILFSKRLGISVIQLAGYDVYYEPSTSNSIRLFTDGMREACRMASTHQVMLAMETMDTPFMCSVKKCLRLKQQLPCPWLSLYPDMGNLSAWKENDVFEELSLGLSSTVAVHVKETLREGSGPTRFKGIPFGSGCVDFPAVFAHMEALGYLGPYTLEMWHRGCNAEENVKKALAFISHCFPSQTSQ